MFEVKRSDGSVAFAVYEDMVWVYTKDDGAKGVKGGFAVGGYNTATKGPADNIMRISFFSLHQLRHHPLPKVFPSGGFRRLFGKIRIMHQSLQQSQVWFAP